MSGRDLPLHARIRRELEAHIQEGRWAPGTRIPTESELGEQYGVSRITVQRALRDLADTGMVVRYRRHGTFVAQTAGEHNLLRATGLLVSGAEMHGDHRVISAQVLLAEQAALVLPDLAGDEAVVQVERHKLSADGGRVAIAELAVLPFRFAPDLLDQPLVTTTTHVYLRNRGVKLGRSRLYVEPHALDDEHAELFGLPVGTPVFRWLRITWSADGDVVEHLRAILPAETSRFYVESTLNGPPF
ncbi:GntR family transcriptional regulator [Saccharopolyspora oryzae]|uniref:GntR family transcriptional regulator n=1 Tax=Saccharopolyspora oryzae TaxID=2997343 RepID=A0ABT4V6Y7_9PSEU|nr:GntR family transcriptional regulator [Saccharopolyspora oryzae]MDA3629139.1 GntR family transcriptional regulator [Saccharopolyspora oryzae]